MEIEAVAPARTGKITITGIVEEEEMGADARRIKRKSTARSSWENVMTLLHSMGYETDTHDIHINFPGGTPVDGPSAGVAMAVAAASALTGLPVDGHVAVTGEVSVRGLVKPVGGVPSKVEAAEHAGISTVLIPFDNLMERFEHTTIQVIPIKTLQEALDRMLLPVSSRFREGDGECALNPKAGVPLLIEEKTAVERREGPASSFSDPCICRRADIIGCREFTTGLPAQWHGRARRSMQQASRRPSLTRMPVLPCGG